MKKMNLYPFNSVHQIKMKYQAYGWDDIHVPVPMDWNMVFEDKKKKKDKKESGYFAFRDSKTKRLEISWAEVRKDNADISKVTKDYHSTLKKSHKKIKIKSEGKRKMNDHTAEYLYWELEKEKTQGYVMVWLCPKSKRLFICSSQFGTREKSEFKPLIMDIMGRINCHVESVFSMWSAPNLKVYSPYLSMKLVDKQFLIGLTFLELKNDKFHLFSYRIGLADQKIKSEDSLPEWFKEYYKKNLPSIPSKFTPEVFKKFTFNKKVTIWKNESIQEKRIALKKRIHYFETYLWYNPDKNDIYCHIYYLRNTPSVKQKDLIDKTIKLAIGAN